MTEKVVSSHHWLSRLPVLQGILPIDKSKILPDVIAGVTLAALAIPEVMGYTRIAGTPVVTGLYTILVPMLLYAIFGSSRHLVVGADSATAAILAGGLAGMAVPGSGQWLSFAGVAALLAALFLLVARVIRLGFLADFLSRTVLVGFLTGVGIQVAAGEISGMLGLSGGGKGVVGKLLADAQQIERVNFPTLALSLGILIILAGSKKLSKKIPGALIAIVGAIIGSWLLHLDGYGIRLLGAIPGGLPTFGAPPSVTDWQVIMKLAPTSFAMFVVILAQSAATSRAYASRRNERFNEDTDLVGLCLANVGAGLSGTFVVNGSPTKTQMVESAGGNSQVSQVTTSVIVLVVLLFLTGPLSYLPTAVLSAVVFLIGVELIDVKGMTRIWHERRWEFWVALVSAATVVFFGVEKSILLSIVMSLAVHTRHGYRMKNMVLVPDQENKWRQQSVKKPQQIRPGLMIYRFMHDMYYANAHLLTEEVTKLVRSAEPPLKWFCIDAAAVDDVDFTAAAAIRNLQQVISAEGTKLVLCEVVPGVRDEFSRSGITALVGKDAVYPSVAAVLAAYERSAK